ncbi:MAG: LPS assembly lipoprotein LptE [Burkholderiaceae bacterium]|nr:LPS assembly lipoprotein LptE [Burkholderiaceae bacterium]
MSVSGAPVGAFHGRRAWLAAVPALCLAGCGFRLRGVPEFAFQSIYVAAPASSPLGRELLRTLESSGGTLQVLRDPAQLPRAEAIFDLLSERQERAVVGLTATGQVRELQLRLRIRFRLRTPAGEELIPETELLQQRDISYSETIALAKETEEALLHRNMQTDLVQQLLRRLAAVKR